MTPFNLMSTKLEQTLYGATGFRKWSSGRNQRERELWARTAACGCGWGARCGGGHGGGQRGWENKAKEKESTFAVFHQILNWVYTLERDEAPMEKTVSDVRLWE